ncbi:hypothetical protein GCM10010398_67310 [Streptomyces fimbriatus]
MRARADGLTGSADRPGAVCPARGVAASPALASARRPETLRQTRWTNTMIENLPPQVLTSP